MMRAFWWHKKKPQNKKSQKKGSKISLGFLVVLAVIIAAGLAAGVVAAVLTRGGGETASEQSGIKLPDYAFSPQAPKGADIAYQFAVDRPDLLAQIPCYCGCGQLDGHKNNLDCFVKSRNGDKVVFDDHAFG